MSTSCKTGRTGATHGLRRLGGPMPQTVLNCPRGCRVANCEDRRCANRTHVWTGTAATQLPLGASSEWPAALRPANVGVPPRGAPQAPRKPDSRGALQDILGPLSTMSLCGS